MTPESSAPRPGSLEPLMADAAEMLWVVLANVSGGDWTKQSVEWQEAAQRWRDNYFAALRALASPRPYRGLIVSEPEPPTELDKAFKALVDFKGLQSDEPTEDDMIKPEMFAGLPEQHQPSNLPAALPARSRETLELAKVLERKDWPPLIRRLELDAHCLRAAGSERSAETMLEARAALVAGEARLREYGQHKPNCDFLLSTNELAGICTCGFLK